MRAITSPQLPRDLTVLSDLLKAAREDEALSGFTAVSQDLSAANIYALAISEAQLDKVTAMQADFEKIGLSDVILTHADWTATNCAEASWRRVHLDNIRGSGLKLQTSTQRDVVFDTCKLNLSNFRFAKMRDVLFKDCILDEADFYGATLESVRFQHCSLQKVTFSTVKCKHVDLRTSDLFDISGVDSLRGATIDSVQLIALAQTFAAQLGLRVSDE
jgi:uncharacterized protein YjbI with pentapeptide repeats